MHQWARQTGQRIWTALADAHRSHHRILLRTANIPFRLDKERMNFMPEWEYETQTDLLGLYTTTHNPPFFTCLTSSLAISRMTYRVLGKEIASKVIIKCDAML